MSIWMIKNNAGIVDVTFDECMSQTPDNGTLVVLVQQVRPHAISVRVFCNDEESGIGKVLVGVGTTKHGLQIRPLTSIGSYSSSVVLVEVPHGTPVYVTAVVKNNAGLLSTFRSSEPLIIDHTPPVITNVKSRLIYDRNGNSSTEVLVSINVTWTVEEEESEVKVCQCSLGKIDGGADIVDYKSSDELTSCLFENTSLTHGNSAYVSVMCINTVELASITRPLPQIVSYLKPDSEHAKAEFVVQGDLECQNSTSIHLQTRNTDLKVKWSLFKDKSEIIGYECQLLHGEDILANWTKGVYKDYVTLEGLTLVDGERYKANVRAINTGHHVSDPISAEVLVYGKPPKLTGRPITVIQTQKDLHIDWTNTFELDERIPYQFTLLIGSKLGFSDIVYIQATQRKVFNIRLKFDSVQTRGIKAYHIIVQATYGTGLSTVYFHTFELLS